MIFKRGLWPLEQTWAWKCWPLQRMWAWKCWPLGCLCGHLFVSKLLAELLSELGPGAGGTGGVTELLGSQNSWKVTDSEICRGCKVSPGPGWVVF